jgi:hypothetical protein
MNKKLKTPIKSIRDNCLECSGGSYSEVRNCLNHNCPLYPYRLGKRPTQADIDTYESSSDEN